MNQNPAAYCYDCEYGKSGKCGMYEPARCEGSEFCKNYLTRKVENDPD